MKTIFKSIICSFVAILMSQISFAQNKYTVTVTVKGIQKNEGSILAIITDDAANFPQTKGFKSTIVDVNKDGGDVFLTFDEIPEGKYAIVLYQDLNGNSVLDMNGQMPAEPFGFSNVTMLMGPPSFSQCAFEIKGENKILDVHIISF